MKIIGVTVGTTIPKPNLMQDDPSKGDYVKGKEEFVQQINGPNSSENVNAVEPADDDIPKVFFTGTAPTTKDQDELPLTMEYISKTKRIFSYVTLKVQGDTSAGYPKKNFNLKMFSDEARAEKLKMQFRNWKAKTHKYCLKANWIDHTHARNVVGGRLWNQIVKTRADYESYPAEYRESSNSGAVDGFPVKVYLNGVYQGLYTWNIRKDESMFNMDDGTGVHAALIADAGNPVTWWHSLPSIDGSDWTDELNDTVPGAVKTGFRAAYTFVMNSTDDEFKENIEQYFYLSSLIDYYIYIYSILMIGGLSKSQTMFTYDAVKYLANIYDMDTTWTLHWNGGSFYDTLTPCPDGYMSEGDYSNLLYERVVALYPERIRERYAELRETVLSDANIINEFERFMDVIPNDLYTEDFASTTAAGAFVNIPSKSTNTLQKLREVIVERMAYCDKQIPLIRTQVPCAGITLDKTELTFNGEGAQVLTATVEPADTTEPIIWSSNYPYVASVDNNGTVTAVSNGDAIITVTCGNHSATCSVTVSGIKQVGEGVLTGVRFESGTFDSNTGADVTNAAVMHTSFCPINGMSGKTIAVVPKYSDIDNWYKIGYWDANKTFIRSDGTPSADKYCVLSQVPENAEYFKFGGSSDGLESLNIYDTVALANIEEGSVQPDTGEPFDAGNFNRGKATVNSGNTYVAYNALRVVGYDASGAFVALLAKDDNNLAASGYETTLEFIVPDERIASITMVWRKTTYNGSETVPALIDKPAVIGTYTP